MYDCRNKLKILTALGRNHRNPQIPSSPSTIDGSQINEFMRYHFVIREADANIVAWADVCGCVCVCVSWEDEIQFSLNGLKKWYTFRRYVVVHGAIRSQIGRAHATQTFDGILTMSLSIATSYFTPISSRIHSTQNHQNNNNYYWAWRMAHGDANDASLARVWVLFCHPYLSFSLSFQTKRKKRNA